MERPCSFQCHTHNEPHFFCVQFTLCTNVFYLLCGACIAAWANLLAHWWAYPRVAHSVQLSRRTAAAAVISDTDVSRRNGRRRRRRRTRSQDTTTQPTAAGWAGWGTRLQHATGWRWRPCTPRQHVAAKRLCWGVHALVRLPAAAQRAR